jgi:hypothetical protein
MLCGPLSGCCSVGYYVFPAFCYERLCPKPKPIEPIDDADGPGKGRLLTRGQVLEILNERARAIPIFIAADVKLRAVLLKQGTHDLEGTAAIERPRNLRLIVEAPAGTIWLGSNDEFFWLSNGFAEDKRPLAGRWNYVGHPGAGRMPIDPTALFALLGLAEYREADGPITVTYSLGRKPDPAAPGGLSYDPNDFGFYVVRIHRPRDPARPAMGFYTEREFWLLRNRVVPVLFIQYEPSGREIARARIGEYPAPNAPRQIPRRILVTANVYDDSGTGLAGSEVFEFKLGELAFARITKINGVDGLEYIVSEYKTENGKPALNIFRAGFDPKNVPGWDERRLIDAAAGP